MLDGIFGRHRISSRSAMKWICRFCRIPPT